MQIRREQSWLLEILHQIQLLFAAPHIAPDVLLTLHQGHNDVSFLVFCDVLNNFAIFLNCIYVNS